MHLESDSAEPLYIQLAYIIREDIQNGKYNAEQRIPTEKELSEIYSVSRITIRSALEILVKEGPPRQRHLYCIKKALQEYVRNIQLYGHM